MPLWGWMCSKEDTHKFLLSNLANKDETKKGKTEPEMFLEVLTWPPVCLF